MGPLPWIVPVVLHPPRTSFLPLAGTFVRTMLLRPNKMKFRKSQKNIRAVLPRYPTEPVPIPKPSFGAYGIYSTESLRITAAQIESARMSILKTVGRKGLKIWTRIFPHIPVTKKALGVRMGKGKGAVEYFVAHLRAGKMVFEFDCPTENLAKKAYIQVNHRLPVKTKLVIADNHQQKTSQSS